MTSVTELDRDSTIDREQLALEISRDTGVPLSPDDAILVLVAAHDIVLNSYEKRWSKAVKRVEKLAWSMGWVFLAAMLVGFTYLSFLVWIVR